MKILFLDDNETRHNFFREWSIGHDVYHVRTAQEAINRLENNTFDLVFLDHDLGGQEMVASGPGTGYEVATWIVLNKDTRFPHIVVHSYNPVGANNMSRVLFERGFGVSWEPFGPSIQEKWFKENA